MVDLIDRNTMIARYLHARDRAKAMGDVGLLREAEENLRHYGWRPDATAADLGRAEQRAEADAVPAGQPTVKRKPGTLAPLR